MKRALSFALLFALLFVFCGAPPDRAEPEPITPEPGTGESIAYGVLTEAELQKFIKVFPIARTEMEKAGKKIEMKGDDNPIQAMDKYATIHTEIAGLDAKLTAAGMPWAEFWPAYSKTMAAAGAYALGEQMGEGLAEMEAQLKDPKIPDAQKEMMKGIMEGLKSVQKVYEAVPKENVELVRKYWDQLEALFEGE